MKDSKIMTFFWFVKYHHGNIPFCIFSRQSPVITLLMLVYRNLVADIDLLIYDLTYKDSNKEHI